MTNTVAGAYEQLAYAVKETTKGTAVFPSAATELIVAAGSVDINQQPTYTDSDEINDSLDTLARFRDQVGAGTFTIPSYIRPSGAAGTAPMGDVLFESLMGTKTVVASTSVSYTQAKTKPSFTLWVKKDHTVFFGTGACCESGKSSSTNKGGSRFDFSGGFLKMGWAGTDSANGEVTASDQIIVNNAKLFTAGAFVALGSDDNTGAGYEIESVNLTTNTLTMVDTVSCADEAVVKGFLPSSFTPVGDPIENKDLTITFDAESKILKTLDVTINSPVAWQTDEITSDGYVTEYIEDKRSISVNPTALFREQDVGYFTDAMEGEQVAVVAVLSDGAGKICTMNYPYTTLEVPNITTSAPTVSLTITGTALGNVGEDSCSIVFT